MAETAHEYKKYFTNVQQVKVGIKLTDNKFLEVGGLVRFIEGDRLTLELLGTEPVEETAVAPGADVFITAWTGWSMFRCSAVLTQKIYSRRIFLRLTGPVIEKQTREYFRLDVSIPLCFVIPEKQLLTDIHEEWTTTRKLLSGLPCPVLQPCPDGFKLVRWNDQGVVMPQMVNLSGGGMRFKTPENVKPGTLVAINLFLPLVPPRVIHAVAETLRCNEIMLGREQGKNYITAMRFHFITDNDRETIIAFIFAEQRRLLSTHAGNQY